MFGGRSGGTHFLHFRPNPPAARDSGLLRKLSKAFSNVDLPTLDRPTSATSVVFELLFNGSSSQLEASAYLGKVGFSVTGRWCGC